MTIATLNIDWARTYKTKSYIYKIEEALNRLDADILVLVVNSGDFADNWIFDVTW